MKRSEALKLITNIISEVTYENLAEKRAEKILSMLEKTGMKPPFKSGLLLFAKFEWDEENDTE